jgi:sporulation protein YlmC with PRC-barrel domain
MSRFNSIGAVIAIALVALPAIAQQTAQEPTAPSASTAPEPSQTPAPQDSSQALSSQAAPPSLTGVVTTTNNPNLALATVKLESGKRASKIIGAAVQNDQNQRVGTVDDLILSPESKVTMAVVSVGGFLGVGNKLVAVPWGQLKAEGDHLVLPGATKDTMGAAPGFQY